MPPKPRTVAFTGIKHHLGPVWGLPAKRFCVWSAVEAGDEFLKTKSALPSMQGFPWAQFEKPWASVVFPWGSAGFEQKGTF